MQALRDAHAESRKRFVPMLRTWQTTLSRVSVPEADRPALTSLLERATAMRSRLRALVARADPLLADERGGPEAKGTGGGCGGPEAKGTTSATVGSPRKRARGGWLDGTVRGAETHPGRPRGDEEGGEEEEADDDEEDEDEFDAVVPDLKPGYEPEWVDPDAGWERPPPEAMRSPQRGATRGGAATTEESACARTFGGLSGGAAVSPSAAGGMAQAGMSSASGMSNDGARRCGAPRRDGSLCARDVPRGGACEFHGAWMERDLHTGLPTSPAEGSVWAMVVAAEALSRAGDAARSAAPAAMAAAVEADESAASAAAAAEVGDSRRSRKAPMNPRQRLKHMILKGERRAAATIEAANMAASERQHKMRQMW
jgi:hypothetical protein